MKILQIALILLISFQVSKAEYLNASKVHLVAYNLTNNNYFFRGNQPDINGSFPLNQMYDLFMESLGRNNLGTPQEQFYLIDISLEDILDDIVFDGFEVEQDFWKNQSNQAKGQFIDWEIGLSGFLPPDKFSFSQTLSIKTAYLMAKIDNLLNKIQQINQMLTTKIQPDLAAFIYAHCDEGCDRTGMIVGAYRLKYTDLTFQEILDLNKQECGRVEDTFSQNGLVWFCIYYLNLMNQDISPCQSATF